MKQWQAWQRGTEHVLLGKTIAITGATGGLGRAACRYILSWSGNLILLNRSQEKTQQLKEELLKEYPKASIEFMPVDLSHIETVKAVCGRLKEKRIDVLVLNAGAYSIPRTTCSTGYDNVFQINFLSHYYMVKTLLPQLSQRGGKIVAVGSIAHTYSKTDPEDVDFSRRTRASLVYGNSKRYLMFALTELLKHHSQVQLSIAHPGISFTNITAHYPKLLFAIIKWPMKVIFMKPALAVQSILRGILEPVPYLHWVGPRWFNVWGRPSIKKLTTCSEEERARIFSSAEAMYQEISAE